MKKISLLTTALLVASSLFATPTLKADRLSQKQFTASPVAVNSIEALSGKKAPQQTAATYTITVSEMGAGVGLVKWTQSTMTGVLYYAINIYNGDNYLGGNVYQATSIANQGISTYEILGQVLPVGTYEVYVFACKVENNELSPIEGVYTYLTLTNTNTPFELSDLTITTGADNKTTIAWKESGTKPANAWLNLYITSGTKVVYDNDGDDTNTWPVSPVTLDLPAGAMYNINLIVLPTTTVTYAETFAAISESYTVGVNNLLPTNLKATISGGDTAILSWSAVEKAPYYWVEIFDSKGQNVGLSRNYTNNSSYGIILYPDTYTWTVQAMTVSGNSLYPASDVVTGAAFTTEDLTAPVVTDIAVSEITTNSAKVSFTATDRWTKATDMMAVIYTNGFDEVAFPELQEDGTFVADISMIPGEEDMEPLKPSTTYEFTINVFDAFYNMAVVPFNFTTLADATSGLANMAAADITYENGIILNANGEQLRVYNAAGQLVAEGTRNIDMNTFAAGVYVINAQQTTFKIVK